MAPKDFIAALTPAAKASAVVSNIPASFTIAEAALESGWGSTQLATLGHNLFGVKADKSWKGDTISMRTREFLDGQWVIVPALWRKYPDWYGSITDHATFLISNPRYHKVFDHSDDAIAFTRAVAAAGYATDPGYANKIISVISTHKLLLLDEGIV